MRMTEWGTHVVAAVIVFLLALFVGSALAQNQLCYYCGMERSKFGHSWVVVEHEAGPNAGVCSIHCAAIHMALSTERKVTKVTVGDFNTKRQIDADTASWVIGGNRMGVMTSRAKWAFETRDAAEKFITGGGGRLATYEEALKAAFEDMYEDTLMIQEKRRLFKLPKN